MIASCPVCHGDSQVLHDTMFDDRFGCPMIVEIRRCPRCPHMFTSPALRPEEVGSLYEQFYGRSESSQPVRTLALKSRIWRWVTGQNNLGQFVLSPITHPYLLDVGSGDCQNLWEAVQLGFHAVGYDVDQMSTVIGDKNQLTVRSGDSIETCYSDETFDAIQLNQVLEHYFDPSAQVRQLRRHLRTGGLLFISTPNAGSAVRAVSGRRWINWHVPYHQQHFTRKSLKQFLMTNGFEVRKVRTVTPLVWTVLQIRQLRRRSDLGRTSAAWVGPRRRGTRVLELAIVILLFVPIRFLDLIGFGDSIVLVASSSR